jgi:ABC-2 type transport system permease protein
VWIASVAFFSAALAPGIEVMFPDAESKARLLAGYENPVMTAMMGPLYGAGESTGAMYAGFMLLWTIVAAAVMNIFFIARHTRADEERGRAEVVRSLPAGRLANVNAAVLSAVIINAALAAVTGLGVFATQTESMDFTGCMLYGAVLGASGLVFAGVAAVFCQLSGSAGGAAGLSFFTLGAFYLLRAAGDLNAEILSLISPLGLAQRSRVFTGDDALPAVILLVEAAALFLLSFKLNCARDLGRGFIPERPGRSEAGKTLSSPLGLPFRLLRKTAAVWLAVMFSLGASYGLVISDIGKFVENSPEYLALIGVPAEYAKTLSGAEKTEMLTEYFVAFINAMMALIALIPLLAAAMKPRAEEKAGRAEHVLARPVSRTKYLCGFITAAFVLSWLLQCASALGLYCAAKAAPGAFALSLGELAAANLVYLPAVWAVIGAAVFLTGLLPKAAGAIWGYYGFICFMGLMGGLNLFPDRLEKLNPMTFVPKLPLEEAKAAPLAVTAAVALALFAVGLISYARRDISA